MQFRFSFLRYIPIMVVMAPADENERWQILFCGARLEHPSAMIALRPCTRLHRPRQSRRMVDAAVARRRYLNVIHDQYHE